MYRWLLVLSAVIPATGCTNLALNRDSLKMAESLTDLRYQEVMENLAMIAANPATLPSFSSIYAGTTDVSDTVSGNSVTTLTRVLSKPVGSATNISAESNDVMLMRMVRDNWTLDPVVVPEKLRALRLACWWVLFGPEAVTNDYDVYLTHYRPKNLDPNNSFPGDPAGFYFDVADRLAKLDRCWLHVTNRKGVPWNAAYQAHCGNIYVWVARENIPQLSEFALVIQGIARVTLPSVYNPTPVVQAYKVTYKKGSTPPWNPAIDNLQVQSVSFSIDEKGNLAGQFPLKVRMDNLGSSADLRSQIANAKSP